LWRFCAVAQKRAKYVCGETAFLYFPFWASPKKSFRFFFLRSPNFFYKEKKSRENKKELKKKFKIACVRSAARRRREACPQARACEPAGEQLITNMQFLFTLGIRGSVWRCEPRLMFELMQTLSFIVSATLLEALLKHVAALC